MKLISANLSSRGLMFAGISMLLTATELCAALPAMPDDEAAGFLRVTAAGIADNAQQIRTWRGRFEITSRSLSENPMIYVYDTADDGGKGVNERVPEKRYLQGFYVQTQQATGEFVTEPESDRLYSTYQTIGSRDYRSQDGEQQFSVPVDTDSALHQESILTKDDFLHMNRNAKFTRLQGFPELAEPPSGYHMLYRESAQAGHELTRTSTVFDPRRMLESGGRPMHFMLKTLADWIESDKLDVKVTRTDDVTWEVHYQYLSGEQVTKTLTQINDQVLMTGSLLKHAERGTYQDWWEYSREVELTVPVAHRREHHNSRGQLQYSRATRLLDIRMNEPVSDDEFALSRFNMEPMARYFDRERNERKIYQDRNTIVSANEFSTEDLPPGTESVLYNNNVPVQAGLIPVPQFNVRRKLILVNLLLIAVISVTLFWQRYRAAIRPSPHPSSHQ